VQDLNALGAASIGSHVAEDAPPQRARGFTASPAPSRSRAASAHVRRRERGYAEESETAREPGSADGSENALRLVRVIARLNVGGPAIQAITLTRRMSGLGYRTRLVRGREQADEGSMDYLARELCVEPVLVPSMRRNPGWRDLPALVSLVRVIRSERPLIIHTHAAKGGTLGRLAALCAFPTRRKRPVLIHTYHGHSLTGYFSRHTAGLYRRVERFLARQSDVLIAVSDEVRDELIELGVAERDRFAVVPLGFDLTEFQPPAAEREQRGTRLRDELGIARDAPLVTMIARLAPIKRVDRFLRIADEVAAQRTDARFLVVGDGELREQLRASADARGLNGRLLWAGFRRDVADVCFASDVVVLTSDNEGTPVSLIEAQAAGTPVVSTRVGGVPGVVRAGRVVERDDEPGLAAAVCEVLDDRVLVQRARTLSGELAADFSLDALVERLDALYGQALEARR
jgi:glycosyltransferase involved in cell wall biosynthesis